MTLDRAPLKPDAYRDMQLLHEIGQTPHLTQRDLSKRIGIALGLTNLMLRRFITKGYIKMTSPKKGKIRYLLTRKGFLEKTRLTCEYIDYSLHLYSRIRGLLHERLAVLGQDGSRRIVLCGTGELAEIACLTIQEMGLQLVSVVSESPASDRFLGYPVKRISDLKPEDYDWFVVVSLESHPGATSHWVEQGVLGDRIISVSFRGAQETSASSSAAEHLDPEGMDVVILCGGKGTRLGSITNRIPKPLLPVGRHPFLLWLLLHLEQQGFNRFVLAAHYLTDQFRSFLGTYAEALPNVKLVVEPQPLGTGGAIRHALSSVRSSTLVVINGDSWVSQPLEAVLDDHRRMGRVFTVVAVQASNVEGGALKKGVWRVGSRGEVLDFATEELVEGGWVNAGIYVLERSFADSWPEGPYSLEENLNALLAGKKTGVFCSTARLLDIGTPRTYEKAQRVLGLSETLMPVVAEAGHP